MSKAADRCAFAAWWAGLVLLVLLPGPAVLADVPNGKSDFLFKDERGNADRPIQVWLYRPAGFGPDSPIVFVMHGTLRNGETYREPWIPIADRHGCLVVVPEFSTMHYPGMWSYHFGNLRTPDGKPVAEEKWTFTAIEHLFDRLRQETGSRRERYGMFGHSAGAQFVHRMVVFKPDARLSLAVAANSGSYTMPDRGVRFPYGLEGADLDDAKLKRALQAPLMILLGEKDTDPNDRYLPRDPSAQKQGPHRLERGRNFYKAAQAEAERLQTPLRWKLQTVPEVGHDNALMAPAAARLLLGG